MSIVKYCRQRGCTRSGCEHPWYFDKRFKGTRYKCSVDEFVRARMEPGEPFVALTKTEIMRQWEPRFLAELQAGGDPRLPLVVRRKLVAAGETTVAMFLDDYFTKYVLPSRLDSVASIKSRIKTLKAYLGALPVKALEEPDQLNHFKVSSAYAEENKIASVHRCLEVIRTAINWGRVQKPPFLASSPFHKFGVTLSKRDEVQRDRRISRDEERLLMTAALKKMNTPERMFAGPVMRDRIVGALELLCRRGEMMLIQNRRVYWDTFQIGIPGATAKDGDNRRIPFDPNGPLMPILEKRKKLGPLAYVFGTETGEFQAEFQSAWNSLRLLAYGFEPKSERYDSDDREKNIAWNRAKIEEIDLHWQDLRHEGACRLLADDVDIRTIQLMLGHSTLQQTQRYLNVTDDELRRKMETSWAKHVTPKKGKGRRGLRVA